MILSCLMPEDLHQAPRLVRADIRVIHGSLHSLAGFQVALHKQTDAIGPAPMGADGIEAVRITKNDLPNLRSISKPAAHSTVPIARLLHAYELSFTEKFKFGRFWGTALTYLVMVTAGVLCIYQGLRAAAL